MKPALTRTMKPVGTQYKYFSESSYKVDMIGWSRSHQWLKYKKDHVYVVTVVIKR
jgi:hypothetical protein